MSGKGERNRFVVLGRVIPLIRGRVNNDTTDGAAKEAPHVGTHSRPRPGAGLLGRDAHLSAVAQGGSARQRRCSSRRSLVGGVGWGGVRRRYLYFIFGGLAWKPWRDGLLCAATACGAAGRVPVGGSARGDDEAGAGARGFASGEAEGGLSVREDGCSLKSERFLSVFCRSPGHKRDRWRETVATWDSRRSLGGPSKSDETRAQRGRSCV